MKRTLFLIEDHDVVRESYVMFLNLQDDLEVCGEAASGEEALELLRGQTPDLLLVDVSLPGMSGLDLLRRLRDAGVRVPALVLSGHDEAQYRRGALEAGAMGFVAKQAGPDVLLDAIRDTLGEGAPA